MFGRAVEELEMEYTEFGGVPRVVYGLVQAILSKGILFGKRSTFNLILM